jgi:hypothetical protein
VSGVGSDSESCGGVVHYITISTREVLEFGKVAVCTMYSRNSSRPISRFIPTGKQPKSRKVAAIQTYLAKARPEAEDCQ